MTMAPMAQTPNLQTFLAGAERGARSNLLPPGYFAKQTYLNIADTYNATYGRKVWDSLNNQTRFWNVIRKVQWGPTTGWRLRTDRGGNRSGPVPEGQPLPVANKSNYVGLDSNPRNVTSVFGVSLLNQIMSGLEGGLGDTLVVEQEATARDHIKELNRELLLRNHSRVTSGGSAKWVIDSATDSFRAQDKVAQDGADGTEITISNLNPDGDNTNEVTLSAGTGIATGDILYVKERAGFTSLDDIVHQDGLTIAGKANINVDVYDVRTTANRTANTWYAGTVLHNSGRGRNLNLALLDQAIRTVRQNGGDPDMILCGYDQYDRVISLLQANQRYMGRDTFVVKMGEEQTMPGTHAGFDVATYRDIPIFVDVDVATGLDSTGGDLGSYIYVLDTRYLEMAVVAPTQYIDNRDFFQANQFVLRGLFYTYGELRSLRMDTNVKIIDLNA